MINTKDYIQKIPSEIIDAAIYKKLVIFIGAGVSTLAGCKSWGDLSNQMIEELKRQEKITENIERYMREEKYDNKKKITIAKELLDKDTFERLIEEALTPDESKETSDI